MIRVDNISMLFNMSTERVDNIKEYVVRLFKGNLHFQQFWALQNISFHLDKGDALGIVGLNGSGKSTLLKLIAGVLKPTKGSIAIYGNIAPLIELGAGFDADLSARENIFLNGAILGYSHDYMEKRFDSIIKFAELENFIDIPIKNYSSGMTARLGFAIATMNQPDILILDEVLAVGDYKFQEKSFARTKEIIDKGATVLFVSHSIDQVQKLCNKALWLEKGQIKMLGDSKTVCEAYSRI
ncbi:ABC-2 type transport system ATP-binding protein/lipopolysaccharide transport system ATP-binding protein [Hydrogenoanaerobacterium saccharovorans]|uniref:ABC-2 type transport system ATP-binding protein/lipopolysaccharide transport system ATP-binding protein n=1 Tax=Hydrogenoanaerobacterium saccharovorans TaxID=474960 RepID=A0A1H8EF26_9FIRM|nr:ABC transporter ATP-binding protein [Hydrogenoanaerobacterium saccharovorans]RPF42140.1 ABC-2 type transport system ATP-binding protein/lipopolysaccharide transport system ATP-binding protein [Hydrogenoanaerobacterium saccharovorans]SEN18115.1 ABC-2 type transport system ATP-binding protein/lipopolysaccharide transport system ATP-binding protein [Hydrogenoanaerobacterium saccharovorans]